MSALSQISNAECVLNHCYEFETINSNYAIIDPKLRHMNTVPEFTLAERLDIAVSLYWKALATLKVTISPVVISFIYIFVCLDRTGQLVTHPTTCIPIGIRSATRSIPRGHVQCCHHTKYTKHYTAAGYRPYIGAKFSRSFAEIRSRYKSIAKNGEND